MPWSAGAVAFQAVGVCRVSQLVTGQRSGNWSGNWSTVQPTSQWSGSWSGNWSTVQPTSQRSGNWSGNWSTVQPTSQRSDSWSTGQLTGQPTVQLQPSGHAEIDGFNYLRCGFYCRLPLPEDAPSVVSTYNDPQLGPYNE